MALGIYPFSARITTDTDTELFAAPSSNAGKPERINLRSFTMDVEVAAASAVVRLENGAASGDIIATIDAADDNNRVDRAFHVNRGSRGLPLSENTALSAESTSVAGGGVVVIRGEVEVTGG